MSESNVVWKVFSKRDAIGQAKIRKELKKFDQIDLNKEYNNLLNLIKEDKDCPLFGVSFNSKMIQTGRNLKKIGFIQFIYQVGSINLPAGITCDAAHECFSYAKKDRNSLNKTGTVLIKNLVYSDQDGRNYGGWCYASQEENQYTDAYNHRHENLTILLGLDSVAKIAYTLYRTIKANRLKVVRIHSSGDFRSIEYYLAWILVARYMTDVTFFGYTKVLPYLSQTFRSIWTDNIRIQYSFGGIFDSLLPYDDNGNPVIPTCFVELTPNQYRFDKVCIDHKDTRDFHYIMESKTFVLPLH